MRTREFLSRFEHDRIVRAIRDVEVQTFRQIRVYRQRGKLKGDPLVTAQKKFRRLAMPRTAERNAVLIFVAPHAPKFAPVGDNDIHEKSGEQFWQRLVDGMRAHFKSEKFSHALVEVIEETGKALATHFPKRSTPLDIRPDKLV
ncbi:MAG TPA: TPM domain-containing protein [Chthoniobacterales bacterium]|nr:TPM domain-containing protein [Chthoniobacterales bacterium]